MNKFDLEEYESTMEPMRKKLDILMFIHYLIWAAMIGMIVAYCK